VQVAEFATTHPELDAAEAMRVRRDALPGRERGAHGLDRVSGPGRILRHGQSILQLTLA
jgi:hypothetical protein